MPRKLKVFRTPIGFHDAYVAATSQKEALKAWGADVDLFARGVAEAVTDDDVAKEPLANPGKVIRRLRGTSEEHMAALPEDRPRRRRVEEPRDTDSHSPRLAGRSKPKKAESTEPSSKPAARKPAPKPKPRPSRAKLDAAEKAIEQAQTDHERAVDEIRKRERELQHERHAMEVRHEAETRKLEAAAGKARDAYSAALAKWRG